MNTKIHRLPIIITAGLLAARCVAGAYEATNATASVTNATFSLTLRDCVERALQNNLDIKVQRIVPALSSWGVVSAQSAYDPTLTGSTGYQDSSAPTTPERARSLGLSALQQQNWNSQLGLNGYLPSGGTLALSTSDDRQSGTLNSNFVYTGTTTLSLTQPLLRDFLIDNSRLQIRLARKQHDSDVQRFINQVITSVTAVQNAYYELVFAIENYKAKLEDLSQARQLLDETRRKVQIGVSSPLEVTTAESGVASREEALILAERTIKDNENALKLLISQDVSEFHGVSLVPVDYPVVEMVETDVARSIRTALEMRPDYLISKLAVESQNIQVKFNRNQLWPSIDLNGSYGWSGIGGAFNDPYRSVGKPENATWAGGVSITIPLGNRQARSSYERARLQSEQLLLQLKQLEQQIVIAVDNAVGHVQTNLKSVEAASVARRLAEESYRAERTKLQAGTSTTLNVLTQESNLADARSAEIRARASYSESLVALAQAEGTTLQRNNIVLDERF
jgi:outer membrane protein